MTDILQKKVDRRNAAVTVLVIAVIILLLLWAKKKAGNTFVKRSGLPALPPFGSFNMETGDINLGGYNVGGVTVPDFTSYDQQSSCGCATVAEITGAGSVYYAPAKVKAAPITNVMYQTIVVAPPKPRVGIGMAYSS